MLMQEVLAATTVALAAAYLAFKLFFQPAWRARRPDVPAARLVRRRRDDSGCH